MKRLLLAAILSVGVGTAQGAGWIVEGRVVGVSDGDTITVLGSEKKQYKIRMNGIDALEKGQAFGKCVFRRR
jgi:endonuclease YncB( thermonuclease family)